ncbi:hypothetical protein OG401_23855 [Kitasatospora purpeofusca]|uniref:hypothetical protein n=1 Tax=Kitasatospora purpeofusca TaxID=67352 RepID=UPI0022596465|nr:hypothetical protein [Kitasatospora purpeofusca]MCX4687299.1 hypothetical protein [Kitasatospora purpeofusca]
MSSQYRVLFVEFISGAVWGELPVSDLSFSQTLNAPGAATVKVPLNGAPLRGMDWQVLQPWRVLIYVQRGRQVLWGGPLVSYGVDLAAEEMTLSCQGLWAYYRRRTITSDAVFVQQDQASIATYLLAHYGDGTYGGAEVGPKALAWDASYATGVKRDRSYFRHEWKSVGKAVEDLAAVRDGFDFRITHGWGNGRIVNTFSMLYPTTISDTGVVLDHGGNCDVVSFSADGTNMTTEAISIGAGQAESQLVTWWYNPNLEKLIPRLSGSESRSDVSEVGTLAAYAQRAIGVGAQPVVIPSVRLHPDRFPGVSDIAVGDVVEVRALVAQWPGMRGKYKVTEIQTSVADGGETTTLSLVPTEVFASVGSFAKP